MSLSPSISTSGSTIGTMLRRLAERGVTRQRVRVGPDRGRCRDAGADVDHRAPLGEPRALLVVFRQALGELVEADGDEFAGQPGSGLVPLSTLMPGIEPAFLMISTSGVPSFAFCQMVSSYRMTPEMCSHALRRAEQHLAIVAAIVLSHSTLMVSNRFLMVPLDSSAARMPLPGAVIASATLLRSARSMSRSPCR